MNLSIKHDALLALLLSTIGTLPVASNPSISVPLTHHLNDIDSVFCNSDRVVFLSRDGAIVHSRGDSLWSIDLTKRYVGTSAPLSEYFEHLDNPMSKWLYAHTPPLNSYTAGLRALAHDSTLMLLGMTAGEGSPWSSNFLLDTLRQQAYRYPLDRTKAFDFDNEALWTGRFTGLSKIQRAGGQRSEYVVLPIVTENSSVLIDSLHLWIAADDIGIQRIDLQTKELVFWRTEDILSELHERLLVARRSYEVPKRTAVFTNFAPTPDRIYIACHYVDGGNYLVHQSSYLLEFQYPTQQWESAWLVADAGVPCEGISLLKVHDQFLVLGGSHHQGGGCSDPHEFGGIFLFRLGRPLPGGGYSVINERDVDLDHLVTSMRDTDSGGTLIETFVPTDYGRKRTYLFDSELRISVVSDSVGGHFAEEYLEQKRLGNPRGPSALPDSLRELRVTPEVWQLRDSLVEVMTY